MTPVSDLAGSLHSTRASVPRRTRPRVIPPVKGWREPLGDDPQRDHEETAAAIEAAGIDLDPVPPGYHRHADEVHPSDHSHPHQQSGPGEHPTIGIVGAGAVGTALGVALSRAGWPVHAVASRDRERRDRAQALIGAPRAFAEAQALVEEVELILVAIPDDALPGFAAQVRMYGGQAMVHTSGALDADVLAPAMAAGTQIGAFHPLVAFAETERAVEALRGATIAIEGDDQLADLLGRMAEAIGGRPVRLEPGSKGAYHAAAVLAAGGFVALLDAIAELGRVAGLDEAGSLAIYGPLIEGTLANARALGISAALTGPMTRGDAGTLTDHLRVLRDHAPDVLDLYRAAAEREIAIASARGALAPERVEALRDALARAD